MRWTRVSTRMPKTRNPDGWLIFDGKGVLHTNTHPSWWNTKDRRGREYDGPKVTHWMKMPERPRIRK